MSVQIYKKSIRASLKSRREPYWAQLGEGKHLGFRKIDDVRGTWIAKYRDSKVGRTTNALGDVSEEFDFDAAKIKAEEWFATLQGGIKCDPKYTVEQAARDYIADRRVEKGDACADDLDVRFRTCLYHTPLAKMACVDVMALDLKTFRDAANGGKRTKNRKLQIVRGALRCAVRLGKVIGTKDVEWKKTQPFGKKALKGESKGKRDVYLTVEQRRKLIDTVEPAAADLVRAAALTGARPGEVARMRRKQYDNRTRTLTIHGKTGTREIPLSAAAVTFFEQASRSKLPEAWMFPNTVGNKWCGQHWARFIRRAAMNAELPRGTCLYTFRHCFITDQLTEGCWTGLEVAKYCGTSIQMIDEHYGHLTGKLSDKLARVAML